MMNSIEPTCKGTFKGRTYLNGTPQYVRAQALGGVAVLPETTAVIAAVKRVTHEIIKATSTVACIFLLLDKYKNHRRIQMFISTKSITLLRNHRLVTYQIRS